MTDIARAPHTTDVAHGVTVGARNATLSDLAEILKDQQARKVDVVVPAPTLRSKDGIWMIDGVDPQIDDDGVTLTEGRYRPTAQADDGLSSKLGIPRAYLRRMRDERIDIYDATVNGWLHGPSPDGPPDPRSFLIRCFRGEGGTGIARALLSDRYRVVDHLDVVTAALRGIHASGAEVKVSGCDLTEKRMTIRVKAPGIAAFAPDLLAGYRSPFDGRQVGGGWTPERVAAAAGREGQTIDTPPVVFAGFVISNSETGGGAFTLTPRLEVRVCGNGLVISADALRSVHLGGQLDDGVVRWSDETRRATLNLVTSQARDAVATFLDVDYVRAKVAELTEQAGRPIDSPAETVQRVASALALGERAADDILAHFIAGGQTTAGGLMQAVSSWAQTLLDPDVAADAEAQAVRVLEVL